MIFSNGTQSTYNKAKQLNIPIVSILWIEACKKQLRLVDPSKFSIHNIEQYENPELYKKIKVTVKHLLISWSLVFYNFNRYFQVKKFFQTENELKIKKKKVTPSLIKFKPIKIPKKAKDNLTGMWNDFRERQVKNSNGIDYFADNFNVGDLFNDSKATVGKAKVVNSSQEASNSLNKTVASSVQVNETDKSTSDAGVSKALAKLPQEQQKESPTIFKTPLNRKTMLAHVEQSPNSLVRVTRRTSMLAINNTDTPIQTKRQVMPEEITEITDFSDNQTNNNSEAMEITPNVATSPRIISNRRTIHASSSMDMTNPLPSLTSTRKRNSIIPARFKDFEVNTKKYLGKNPTDTPSSQAKKDNRRRTVFVSSSSTVDDAVKSLPSKRRTLNALKETKFDEIHDSHHTTSSRRETVFAPNEASSPLVANEDEKNKISNLRRTLFKSTQSPLVVTPVTKGGDTTNGTSSKRRRTILPPTASSSLVVSTLKKAAELNGAGSSRRQTVFTPSQRNLDSSDTLVSNTPNEVPNRRRTCFTTSHTTSNHSTPASKGKCCELNRGVFTLSQMMGEASSNDGTKC